MNPGRNGRRYSSVDDDVVVDPEALKAPLEFHPVHLSHVGSLLNHEVGIRKTVTHLRVHGAVLDAVVCGHVELEVTE